MKKLKRGQLDRRNFLKTIAAVGASVSLTGRTAWAQASDQSSVSVLTTREPGKLKMLALTDLHFFNAKAKEKKDEHTLEDIRAMIKTFSPELMIIDGDIWFEDDFGQGFKRCSWACDHLGQMGIPWAFVWGNHDTSEDHHKCHPIISGAANSIYRGTLYDGNYRIEITSPGASAPFWNLIVVNDGMPESGFKREQIKWFREETARIKEKYPTPPPAFAFFHVPLTQFNTIWAKGIAKGVKNEPVQFEKGIPEGFDTIKDSGMVKAVFCGHDHYNNYSGELDGIELQYLRSTGYAGYGGDKVKKGGTIITIDTSKSGKQYESVVVFADGSSLKLDELSK